MTLGTPPRVLLIGMMGAGKTTTGTALAERLGWSLLDSDAEIVRRRGMTVPEIWRAEGEPAYRVQETAVLRDAANSPGPVVISVAGGAVLEATNRDIIRHAGLVVWLRADVHVLAERVGDGAGRPLLDGDAEGNLRRLYQEREPVYRDLAEEIVDTPGRDPAEVVDEIVAAIEAAGVRTGD
jgi:shikimate kinase